MKGSAKIIIIFVIIAMVVIFISRVTMIANGGGKFVQITVPNYSGVSEVYVASEYLEKDGCITFKDGFGTQHKVCGAYQISKW